MRTPESQIKEAILHPEEEIRLCAVEYFSDAHCGDETIMPLVIQSVEKYGRETAFEILRAAERLPQTETTIDWIINELQRDYDLSDVTQENHCIVLAWILHKAPLPILWKRFNDIFTTTAFPEQLRQSFSERLERISLDWDRAWAALKYFAQDTMQRGMTHDASDWGAGIVEALARHRKKAKKVLALLEGRYGDEDPGVMCWLRPWLVALAGEMRLVDAVPLLTNFLDSNLSTRASQALQRIGGDVVVREIDARWWHASIDFRRIAANLLNHLRGDSCVERCLAFFKKERDKEAKSNLALALLGNFSEEAIDLIWKFIADIGEEEFEYHEPDLRYRLVAACTIMGRTFPQFDQWRIAALRDNWGRFDLQPSRMADCLKPEQFGPKWSKN